MELNPATNPATPPAATLPAAAPLPAKSGGGLASELAEELLQCAPKTSPGFAAAVLGKIPEAPADTAPAAGFKVKTADYLRDKEQYIFDRRFCVVGRNGAPRRTPSGLWEMKKDPDTGNRFKRGVVLKKTLRGKPGANTVRVETPTTEEGTAADEPQPLNSPRLVLPGSDEWKETEAPAPGFSDQDAAPVEAAGPSPDAVALASMVDSVYWHGIAPFLAVPAAVEAIKKNQGAAALAALTAGLDQCEDLPRLPWWVPVLTIYGMAGAAMFNHTANQEKALTVKEKIARAWLNFKHGRKKGGENRNV